MAIDPGTAMLVSTGINFLGGIFGRKSASKQRAAEDKLRFGDNIDFEVNKSDVKKLQDFLRKRV